jgi:hypothetical protein
MTRRCFLLERWTIALTLFAVGLKGRKMSDDLEKRLRATTDGATVNPDGPEAADRIAELEAALRPFAGMADYCETDRDSESACVFVGDLRAARAALKGEKE